LDLEEERQESCFVDLAESHQGISKDEVHDVIDVVIVFLELQFTEGHADPLELRDGIRIRLDQLIDGLQFFGGNLAFPLALKTGHPILEMGHPLAGILVKVAGGRAHGE